MKKGFFILTTAFLVFLMVFTTHPQVVLADDGTSTPYETPPVEETPPPEEDAVEMDADNASEQNDSTAQFDEEDASLPEENSGEESEPNSAPEQDDEPGDASEDASTHTVNEVLEQAPEGTDVVVLNEEGEVEPLVSQEAVEIIQNGDPMWCPGDPGDTLPGDGSCSNSYTSFDTLLVDLGNFAGDGTIYVAFDYDSGLEPDDISIDGNTYTNLGALTIQGGWDGNLGSANIIGTSTFAGVSLEIINWGNNVTVNDVILNASDDGLVIGTDGAVSLDNVQVANTVYSDGITLNAGGGTTMSSVDSSANFSSGATINSGGEVSILGSSFDNNGAGNPFGVGLEVGATGEINISNSTAIGNSEGGALLDAGSDINLSSTNLSNNTGVTTGYGLEATAAGNVTLSNVLADSNFDCGAYISSQELVNISNSTFSKILNGEGLIVESNGAVTLASVTASNNVFYGALVTSNGNVTISNSSFSGNTGTNYNAGLEITTPGTVQLNSVVASNNVNDGIAIYDSTNVILKNVTTLNNGWSGVYVEADCATVQAQLGNFSGNGFYGMDIVTGKANISGSIFSNNTLGFMSTDNGGCFIKSSNGPVFSFTRPDTVLPWNIISVEDESPNILDCNSYIGTILVLENGDRIKLPCPLLDAGMLSQISEQNLPANLPEGFLYLSGIKSSVILDGIHLDILNAAITVSYHAEDIDTDLVILYWDGEEWQELASFENQGGIAFGSGELLFWDGTDWTDIIPDDKKIVGQAGYKSPDGYFETVLNFTGVFVLAEKRN
jgi:hypothetical protein